MSTLASIVLTPEQQEELTDWRKKWGDDSAAGRERHLRGKAYCDLYLIKTVKTPAHKPFTCYVEGEDIYCRKDGQPITAEDIKAIEWSWWQCHIYGKPGDMSVIQKWFNDSSD